MYGGALAVTLPCYQEEDAAWTERPPLVSLPCTHWYFKWQLWERRHTRHTHGQSTTSYVPPTLHALLHWWPAAWLVAVAYRPFNQCAPLTTYTTLYFIGCRVGTQCTVLLTGAVNKGCGLCAYRGKGLWGW